MTVWVLDSLPFPRIDRDGFSGGVIPLKRAMLALQVGRGSEAQVLLRGRPAFGLHTTHFGCSRPLCRSP